MKIEIPNLINYVRVDSIGIGQCFLCGEELYMRTNGTFSDGGSTFPVRVVSLSSGAEDGLTLDRQVLPVKMKCVRDC